MNAEDAKAAADAVIRTAAQKAIGKLLASERGERALRHFHVWLCEDGLGLDQENQEAIAILLQLGWSPLRGTIYSMIAEAVGRGGHAA